MRKLLLAAAGFVALSTAAGLALAQDGGHRGPGGMLFQSDSNNDGVVTRQEFDAGRAAAFTRLDANSDGQLTREEQRAGRGERGGPGGHRGGHHRGGGMGDMMGADANHDGAITRDEFLARPIEMFNRLDANHDGIIQASERPQRSERGERPGGEGHQWVNPDTNGDHQLSRAEWSAMGASMFERLDANHDGRVTREEAEAAHPHRPGR